MNGAVVGDLLLAASCISVTSRCAGDKGLEEVGARLRESLAKALQEPSILGCLLSTIIQYSMRTAVHSRQRISSPVECMRSSSQVSTSSPLNPPVEVTLVHRRSHKFTWVGVTVPSKIDL